MGLSTAFKLSAMKPLSPSGAMTNPPKATSVTRVISPGDPDWDYAVALADGNSKLDARTVQQPAIALGFSGRAMIGRLTSLLVPGSRGLNGT